MKRILLSLVVSLAALTFGTSAAAHEPEYVRPLDFDREVMKLDETAFAVSATVGETVDFSANGVKRVTIDETRYVSACTNDDESRLILTPREAGKSMVRVHFADGEVFTFIFTVTSA